MKFETYEYTVPTWSLSIIANADSSGLEDEDIEAFEQFETELLAVHGKGYQLIATEQDLGFCHSNDVDGYAADCHQALVLVPVSEE